MSYATRRYIREKEDLEAKRGYTDLELQASALRKNFLNKYIVNFDTFLYKTQVERDFAYLAKREYRYDVQIQSASYAFATANIANVIRMLMIKKMAWVPLLTVTPLAYLYWKPIFFQKHNKKLFDMCNVGEEYLLGRKRNEVLREANKILDVEDF